jgi:hypothetical protein
MKPIGTARAYVAGDKLMAVVTFAPAGASREADEICALAKAGILNAVSVGFKPIKSEPIRGGGERFLEWELFELSLVAIPCDANALVVARAFKSGRVLSGQNAAVLAELMRCLGKSEQAHSDAIDMLDKANRHRDRAMHHAAQIAASAADSGDAGDDPGDDPEDDVELAFEAENVKLQIEIASRARPSIDLDAERRARMIAVAARAGW